ncbi:MAG: hypothetical protein ACK5NT_08335 [Pyrinomonadaceae bacterium]
MEAKKQQTNRFNLASRRSANSCNFCSNSFLAIVIVFSILGGCNKKPNEKDTGFGETPVATNDNGKVLGDCARLTQATLPSGTFSSDTAEAVKLIAAANQNLCSIRVLYNENNTKVKELEDALKNDDTQKVKALTDDLSLVINDGYVFAESAKDYIAEASQLDINETWREYLKLKESSLDMQIKAFKFRKDSAQLFRDKFGSEDKLQMAQAKQTFKANEENFNKYMKQAEDLNKQADALVVSREQQ